MRRKQRDCDYDDDDEGGDNDDKRVQEITFFSVSISETGFLTPFFVLKTMVIFSRS